MAKPTFLFLEPFYGGSHKQLIDTIKDGINIDKNSNKVQLISLLPKKWHWRARTSALYFSQIIPQNHNFQVLFTSCVLNLAELVALRPDLSQTRKIVYFHENQLTYPVQNVKNRDFQFGYNQILTCIVADIVIFNSNYNKDSFLNTINKFFKLQPDFRPKNIKEQIEGKCTVLYFPIQFPPMLSTTREDGVLHIVWPHRWEHDKDPQMFLSILFSLARSGKDFRISVLGERFSEVPVIFQEAKHVLAKNIVQWGYLESKLEYFQVLRTCHIVVSTARHEFYGVAMLEATYCGCFPLCPNSLVYPEIYPKQCLYDDETHLMKSLQKFCNNPALAIEAREKLNMDFTPYSSVHLIPKFEQLLSLEQT